MTTPIVGEPDDIAKRVQKYTEEMAQPAPGTQSFADWAKGRRT
jgi:hypothetical protein